MLKNLVLAMAFLSVAPAFAKVEKVAIDPAASKVTYVGKKELIDSAHTGEVKIKEGHLNFEGDVLKGGEFTIDMTSITNADLTDAGKNKDFVDHMNSPDFFDTAKHKTAKLVLKTVAKEANNNYKITADLTIKGKTEPVTFVALVTKTEASANIAVDRTRYNVKYGSGKFFKSLGDKVISDEINFAVNLKAAK